MVGNEACGPRLLLAELGMFMDIAPPGDQRVLDLGGALADLPFKIGHGRLRRRRLRPARGEERYENGGAKRKAHVALHQPSSPDMPEPEAPTRRSALVCRCRRMTPAGLTGPNALLLLGPGEYVERRVHGDPRLEPVAHLPDDGFEGPERRDHVGLGDGPHRSPAPHLPGHLALSTGDHDTVLLKKLRQDRLVVEAVRRQDARDGDRMHAVTREDLHTEC